MSNNMAVDLAIAQEERLAKCKKEMDEVMKKYGCKLDVGMIIRPGRIEPLVRVVSDPKFLVVGDGLKGTG